MKLTKKQTKSELIFVGIMISEPLGIPTGEYNNETENENRSDVANSVTIKCESYLFRVIYIFFMKYVATDTGIK